MLEITGLAGELVLGGVRGETSACTCATSGSMLLASIYIVHCSYTKHACFSVLAMFFEHCRKTSLINHAADLR